MNISKYIKKYDLKAIDLADELHKPVRKKFRRRRVYAHGIDDIWASDLVDLSAYSKQNKH